MIPRYTRPEMAKIWEAENRFTIWLEIETLAAEAMEQLGTIPQGVSKAMRERAKFDVARIDEIEREVKHDVIAFLTNVAEYVGEEARFVHQGMTSSDVVDTCLAVQLKQSGALLVQGLDAVLQALKTRAIEHKYTVCVGRSHGIHAEPTTFGVKLAGHHAALSRAKKRLIAAVDEISVCMISGPVGTYSALSPDVEKYVAGKLGMSVETVSTQVIPRDRHAAFFSAMALVASSLENLATEIRHLQRTEVREAEEAFTKGQKGSSAMPHKRNPILSENVTGLARLVRSYVVPALENVTLWHERDISHSSVERVACPDACIALDFALHRMAGLISGLVVHPDRMQRNMDALGGLVFSQSVLLELTQAGIAREDAYRIVQACAMKVWDEEGKLHLKDALLADTLVREKIGTDTLDVIFDIKRVLKHIDVIFARWLATA